VTPFGGTGSMEDALKGKEIVLGVTGSIAAYKAVEIASRLVQQGAGVTVAMTRMGTRFVGPLSFQTLTHRRVLLDAPAGGDLPDPVHVTAAERADLLVVAPATANFLAKAAHGIADDVLTTLLLAVACPVLVAPAMNARMWENAAVRENVRILRERGVRFVDPEEGYLACGAVGRGRMADPARLLAEIGKILAAGR